LKIAPYKFKDLLFHRGSPPCFLPFDLLLWDGKDLALAAILTARNIEVDANHTDSRYNFGTTEGEKEWSVPKRHRMKVSV
jgi:hypothetical protein